jgi:hypothetical protein
VASKSSGGIKPVLIRFLGKEGHLPMNTESTFEEREVIDARLNGLESVMAAAFDAIFSKDQRARKGFMSRLLMLEALLRQQNAHAETVETVDRFRLLVSDEEAEAEPAREVCGEPAYGSS